MPFPFTTVLLAVLAFLVVGTVLFFRQMERRRCERMERAARALGFSFAARKKDVPPELTGFQLFSVGRYRWVSNRMAGRVRGVEVELFDYEYTQDAGETGIHNPHQTVFCARAAGMDLPAFALRPKRALHKLAAWFGDQDIAIAGHPDFTRDYLLRGPDEPAVRALFHESLVRFYDEHPGLCTEGRRDILLVYRAERQVDPEDLGAFLAEGLNIQALYR